MKLVNRKLEEAQHAHKTILSVNHLTFGYTKKRSELHDVSFDIHKSEWTTILGPNGSGKSTIAKLIAHVLKVRKPENILLDMQPTTSFKNRTYAQRIAYVPQIVDVPEGIRVQDFVAFGRNPWLGFGERLSRKDHEIVHEALKKTGSFELKDKMMDEISGGQRQRVLLALAVAQSTEIIILDEPTTYLDIRAQYEVLELLDALHSEGKTVVTILHDINQAVQYSDEIIILNQGKVYAKGKPQAVITEKMLEAVYGVQTVLHRDKNNGLSYLTDIKIIDREKTKKS